METIPNQSIYNNIHARTKLQKAGSSEWLIIYQNFSLDFQSLQNQSESVPETRQTVCKLIKKMILQTDASSKGVRKEEKAVYFASKALTETQKQYVAIELESLVVVWAMGNSTITSMVITSY